MTTEPLWTVDIPNCDNARLAIYEDYAPDNPRVDWDCEPGHAFYTSDRSRYVTPDGEPAPLEDFYDDLNWWAYRHNRFDADAIFERYLRITTGRGVLVTGDIDRSSTLAIYVDGDDIRELGWQDYDDATIRTYLEGALNTYRQWANGDVYTVALEAKARQVTEVRTLQGELVRADESDVWEVVDSLSGCYMDYGDEEYPLEVYRSDFGATVEV